MLNYVRSYPVYKALMSVANTLKWWIEYPFPHIPFYVLSRAEFDSKRNPKTSLEDNLQPPKPHE